MPLCNFLDHLVTVPKPTVPTNYSDDYYKVRRSLGQSLVYIIEDITETHTPPPTPKLSDWFKIAQQLKSWNL